MTTTSDPPVGFGDVDRTTDPAALVATLDEQGAVPAVQGLRTAAMDLLAPRPGQRLLDAGRGTGDMTRALAALVGRSGFADTLVTVDGADPTTEALTTMADVAARDVCVTDAEAESWPSQLADAGTRGRFFWAVTMFAVGGRVQ